MVKLAKVLLANRVIKNTSWIFVGNILWVLMSFGASAFVARRLSISDYGVLQLATTWFLFIQLFENLAHPNVCKIEMVKNERMAADYIGAIGFIGFSLGLLVSSGLAFMYWKTKEQMLFYVFLMALGQMFKVYNGVIYRFDNALSSVKTQVILFAGNIAGATYRVGAAISVPFIVPQLFFTSVVNFSCLLASLGFLIKKELQFKKVDFRFKLIFSIIRKSAPLVGVAFVSLLVYRQDILMLGFFGMEKEIAFYANAVKISEPWGFVASALVTSMLPGIIQSKGKSISSYYRRLGVLFFVLGVLAIGLGAIITLFAKPIIFYSYGPSYLEAVPLLRIHIWSNVFLFFAAGQQVWEVNESMYKFLFLKSCGAALINCALNYCFIPLYGAKACAVISLVTYFFLGMGFNFFHKKARYMTLNYFKILKSWRTCLQGFLG